MKVNLKKYIKKIRTHLDIDVIPFRISINATKLLKNISLSSAHKCIVGYASPNHAILIDIYAEGQRIVHGTCIRGEFFGFHISASAKWNVSVHDYLWVATNIQQVFNFQ